MLKSTSTPIFSTFHSELGTLQKFLRFTVVANVNAVTQCPPPIQQNSSTVLTSAYIHLPFCRKRCHYCDFSIVALGSANPTDADPRISNNTELLLREVVPTKLEFNSLPPLETVFFGGGTPSLVSPSQVSTVLDTLKSKFGVCEDAEISMEMDPGSFDSSKMKELIECRWGCMLFKKSC